LPALFIIRFVATTNLTVSLFFRGGREEEEEEEEEEEFFNHCL